MSLEQKSNELKELVSTYDTQWLLGDLSGLMKSIADGRAQDQLGHLSSPLRQLYFLGGLLMTSSPQNGLQNYYTPEKWDEIIRLLNKIEIEYEQLFFPKECEQIDEEWNRIRQVAMPSFLSYFNQGPLNYEEQVIEWISNLYPPLDEIIEKKTGLKTEHFLLFYKNIDNLIQRNFQGFSSPRGIPRDNWKSYTKIERAIPKEVPDFILKMGEREEHLFTFMADHGIIQRFLPTELVSDNLKLEDVTNILNILSCSRQQTEFLYYTSSKPGNPLFDNPIIDIGDGMYQIFEVKQVIHAIESYLETICSNTQEGTDKLTSNKGKMLENKTLEIFKSYLGRDFEVITNYYIEGCEQDILILWKKYAFIIEAKGYKLNEPFRDPNRAFKRIKQDFDACIGYGYEQARRVEKRFTDQIPLNIEDKNGNIVNKIDTTKFKDNFYSIVVNLKSFGQIQNDLSTLLKVAEGDVFPWAVKLDDLEVILLTFKSLRKPRESLIDFLLMRESLHGKLICSDELQVVGAYLQGELTAKNIDGADQIALSPDFTKIFDDQYKKGLGFKDEKLLTEKTSGKYIFW